MTSDDRFQLVGPERVGQSSRWITFKLLRFQEQLVFTPVHVNRIHDSLHAELGSAPAIWDILRTRLPPSRPLDRTPGARRGKMLLLWVVGSIATMAAWAACKCRHQNAPRSQQKPGQALQQPYTTTGFSELPARCRGPCPLARHVAH